MVGGGGSAGLVWSGRKVGQRAGVPALRSFDPRSGGDGRWARSASLSLETAIALREIDGRVLCLTETERAAGMPADATHPPQHANDVMKYHAIPWLMAAVLPAALICAHADVIVMLPRKVIPPPQVAMVAMPGSLIFNVEQLPGKGGWATCLLDDQGHFMVQAEGMPKLMGSLPAKESVRILEEFEKLCKAAGEERFAPVDVRVAGGNRRFVPLVIFKRATPYFTFMSAQGKKLELAGPDKLPPPELAAFLRILWQKLLFQYAKISNEKPENFHAHPSLR
jgi:hypothetical protein